jgi:hypothetical protein
MAGENRFCKNKINLYLNTLRSGIVIPAFLALTTCLLVDKVNFVGFKASRIDFSLSSLKAIAYHFKYPGI